MYKWIAANTEKELYMKNLGSGGQPKLIAIHLYMTEY